jgi:hypothetical protein
MPKIGFCKFDHRFDQMRRRFIAARIERPGRIVDDLPVALWVEV